MLKKLTKSSNERGGQNTYSVLTDKCRITTKVYLADGTVIITDVYYNGNVKTSVNPPPRLN